MRTLEPGVWGVLPTPFTEDAADVDHASLANTVELYGRIGVNGVVALGVFGEAARLTAEERNRVVADVARAMGADRVVVGLTSTDTAQVCDEARAAIDASPVPLAALMVQINAT